MNPTPGQSDIKTVLELDLAAYSDIASALEENLDVQAVKTFQDQIQSFVDEGLNQLGIRRDDVVFATAGDNALLIFDDPVVMHQFAKIVQEATIRHNRKKSVESAKRWFRMGAATGAVLVIAAERRIVGTTVARAVRLEAAAEKGELLIDTETFDALPEEFKKCYGEEEVVAGKRDELFTVRRCALVSPADRLGKIQARPKPGPPDTAVKADNAEKSPVEPPLINGIGNPPGGQAAGDSKSVPVIEAINGLPAATGSSGSKKSLYIGSVLAALVVVGLIAWYFNELNSEELKRQAEQAAAQNAQAQAVAEAQREQAETDRQKAEAEAQAMQRQQSAGAAQNSATTQVATQDPSSGSFRRRTPIIRALDYLEFTDDAERQAVAPLVQKIIDGERSLFSLDSTASARIIAAQKSIPPTPERTALFEAINRNAPNDELEDLMQKFRLNYDPPVFNATSDTTQAQLNLAQAQLKVAKAQLKSVLTIRREAKALLSGFVE